MNAVELRNVAVACGGRLVLRDITLSVGAHERLAVRGRNGVGKSTLLNAMLGLAAVRCGSVRVFGAAPPSPEVGFVPQAAGASLLPWLSVSENITLPLRLRGSAARARNRALEALCERTDAARTLDLRAPPSTLSLGQSQLVALLRALIGRPRLLLCDEPFSALDAESRVRLRRVLLDTAAGSGAPALVLVTHDAQDVLAFADRCVVLSGAPAQLRVEPERVCEAS